MTTRKAPVTTTGTITRVDHAATSSYGNPTYRITLTDGRVFLTETNGQVGYAARNFEPNRGRHFVVLTIGARGRVTYIIDAPPQLVPGAIPRADGRTDIATCGVCGRSWDDAAVSGTTPTPSGRCPFEYEHEEE